MKFCRSYRDWCLNKWITGAGISIDASNDFVILRSGDHGRSAFDALSRRSSSDSVTGQAYWCRG